MTLIAIFAVHFCSGLPAFGAPALRGIDARSGTPSFGLPALQPVRVPALDADAEPISANVTKTLCASGCDFSDLIVFRDWVYAHSFRGNVTLTLTIADGIYAMTDQFFVADPKFAHIHIIGNVTHPASVVLNFNNNGNNLPGFGAIQGGRLGLIDGVTINGVGGRIDRTSWNKQSFNAGLLAAGAGSFIHAGGHVVVQNFYYGFAADEGGGGLGEPGFTAKNAGDVNIFARHGGFIHCNGCHAETAAHVFTNSFGASETLGANYMAEAGGHLYIDGSTGSDAQLIGAGARTNGSVWAHSVVVSGSKGYGVQADEGGSIEAGHASVHDNAGGVLATARGWINIDFVDVSGNAHDGIVADGGSVGGLSPRSSFNGGYGFKAVNLGSIQGFGALAASTSKAGAAGSNRAGLSFVDPGRPCDTPEATACRPPSLMFLN